MDAYQTGTATRVDGLACPREIESMRNPIGQDCDPSASSGVERRRVSVSHTGLFVVCVVLATAHKDRRQELTPDERSAPDTGLAAFERLYRHTG